MKKNTKLGLALIIAVLLAGAVYVLAFTGEKTALSGKKTAVSDKAATATIQEIVKTPAKYSGKDVAVKGKIVLADKDYYISDQEAKPTAIKLDFSQSSLDPKKYSDAPLPPPKPGTQFTPQPPVTVTGKLDFSQKNAIVLVVQSIK